MFGYNNLRKKVKELEQKVWSLENPPLFKKGDSVFYFDDPMKIIDSEIKYYERSGFVNIYHLIDSNFNLYTYGVEEDITLNKKVSKKVRKR